MLGTSIGIQFNVNDLDANYEVVGTSDNYSFQYNLGRGSELVDFEGEAFQKVISLEGNYGLFDVRIFAVSDIGIRSEFIEDRIAINPPFFEDTFTFGNITITNLPEDANIGSFNSYEPQFPGDRLEVQSEYVGRRIELSWSLIPPGGHVKEGQELTTDLLSDSFFDRFEITLKNGTGSQVIDNNTLAQSAGMQQTLSTANVTGLLNDYRDFSLTLNEASFDDIEFDRTVSVDIVSVDSFGRTATGTITGVNYEPNIEGLTYSLRGSDVSFGWSVNDTDFTGVNIKSLAIPADKSIKYPSNLQSSIDYYQDLSSASNWNYGHGFYRSGDMVLYSDGYVYSALIDHTSSSIGKTPENTGLWEKIGEKINFNSQDLTVNDNISSTTQIWGYSYYYAFQAFDQYGAGEYLNLTEDGLIKNGTLRPFTSEVKIGALRYRERKDDLIFNWDVVDQDGNLVNLDQYRFALTNGDVPSILGISGSLFDSHTEDFIMGITEGQTSRVSSIDQFGNRTIVYDLPNTKIFDTYEYTREINNEIYGTGGFLTNFEIFDSAKKYVSGDVVADENKILYTCLNDTDDRTENLEDITIRPQYEYWDKTKDYQQNDIVEYVSGLYKLNDSFGPGAADISGLFDFEKTYSSGDMVIAPNIGVVPYSTGYEYLAGDVVLNSGTMYLALKHQNPGDNIAPNQSRSYWRTLSIFSEIDCDIYRAINDPTGNTQPLFDASGWQRQDPLTANQFDLYIQAYPFNVENWSNQKNYDSRNFVIYNNDLWSGLRESGPLYNLTDPPYVGSDYWTNVDSNQLDFRTTHLSGDLVSSNGFVYKALADNPLGAPIEASLNRGEEINSSYIDSEWLPYWEINTAYDGFVYGHVGIPESGKRSIGLEVGIIDSTGGVLNSQRIIGINQAPTIVPAAFEVSTDPQEFVDSVSEAAKIKFNFKYAFETQEKTTKVHLYRSENPVFEITGSDGSPFDSTTESGSTLVKVTLGAADASFGDNIDMIFDNPPLPVIDGIEYPTGYYYKILPFDDFGSGNLYGVSNNQGSLERCLVWPKNYSNDNPNGVPGPVFRTSADDIPGTVLNFSGNTSFRNYFFNWSHPSGNLVNTDQFPNDLSHYEVWMSEYPTLQIGSLSDGNGDPIYLKNIKSGSLSVDFSNNSGYRRIDGNIESKISGSAPVPIERQDPALGITNATRIFNVPANGRETEASYFGSTNDTRYFWVRSVDYAGNKSPFTGAANLQGETHEVSGLKLELGKASATEIDDFEVNMTESFGNTIALVPGNPFSVASNGDISWGPHVLYHQGTGYIIDQNVILVEEEVKYLWWDANVNYTPLTESQRSDLNQDPTFSGLKNIRYSGIDYNESTLHPGGASGVNAEANFDDGDFIVARMYGYPDDVKVSLVYHAFANALIGTANIVDAAIVDAKIQNLSADKIQAGEIKGHQITLGYSGANTASIPGSISSAGFADNYIDSNNNQLSVSQGFAISGDGSFQFQGLNGSLKLDASDGTLALEGRLRQSDGTPYDFVDLNSSPSFFEYVETDAGVYELKDSEPVKIVASFRNSQVNAGDVLFRMDAFAPDSNQNTNDFYEVFSYTDWQNSENNGVYNLSGLTYDANPVSNNFTISGAIRHATASFDPGFDTANQSSVGFDDIISAFNASSVVIYCSGRNGNYETTTSVGRVIDGRQGIDGNNGTSPTYRGIWDSNKTYYKTNERSDIVFYDDRTSASYGPYYISKTTHSNQPPLNSSNQLNDSYWQDFGATFSSVATQLLITENSIVTDTIEIGLPGDGGTIVSNGFIGSYLPGSVDYSTAGFLLTRDGNNNVFFDMGGPLKDYYGTGGNILDSGGNIIPSYLRYNSQVGKIEIRGSFTNNTSSEDVTAQINSVTQGGSFANISIKDSLATFVGGGYNNIIGIPQGSNNYLSLASAIVAGGQNNIVGRFSSIVGGYDNYCADNFSFIGGGYNNNMDKATDENEGANFIGAGQNNRIYGGTNQCIVGGSNNIIYNT